MLGVALLHLLVGTGSIWTLLIFWQGANGYFVNQFDNGIIFSTHNLPDSFEGSSLWYCSAVVP